MSIARNVWESARRGALCVMWGAGIWTGGLLSGCSTSSVSGCTTAADCADGERCVNGMCLPESTTRDAGSRDATTRDTSTTDRDASSFDGGMDAGPAICGEACDTGRPCEVGVYDCTDGSPVCMATGPAAEGTTCGEAPGECAEAPVCDGESRDCPEPALLPEGTVCHPASGECDAEEVCDGSSPACPIDRLQPVGTPCSGGSCAPDGSCTDGCVPDVACDPGVTCRTGITDCATGTPRCILDGMEPDGETCRATEFGAWGACAYGATCAESGERTRAETQYTCQSGECTGDTRTDTDSSACMRDTEDVGCGSVTRDSWGSCSGFSDTCDESGNRSRTVHTPTCRSASCIEVTSTESEACSRGTDGEVCNPPSFGSWSSCSFGTTCTTTGTRTRSVTNSSCGDGSCQSSTTSESGSCSRPSTDGNGCGSVTHGPWGTCVYDDACDNTGTQTRTVTTPTCSGGGCTNQMTTETRSCSRDTTGNSCGTTTHGPWGTCSGFVGFCGERGNQTRTATHRRCSAGTCGNQTETESRACSRDTDGMPCLIPTRCIESQCTAGACRDVILCPPGEYCCGFRCERDGNRCDEL